MGERTARSVALERAYVHEVYDQHHQRGGAPRPRVARLLAGLEPGSLVCDVGCGNGKYLNVNPSVFSVGGDRCSRLTELAREKDNQVVMCDNLALPFRDDSFDAVLSIAVVHHFATAERRVRAIRELARVLRIGGRLVISVWAMEQRNRKFESQDVLVPWHRPETLSTPSLELNSNTTTSEDDLMQPPYNAYTQTSDSDSYRCKDTKKKNRTKNKCRTIDPTRPASTSPSTSSLSSPNETCYSFVRRAIQKLAGGKRSVKPWFLDSWSTYSKDAPEPRYDPDGCEDYDAEIQDLPIELRRLEDEEIPLRRQTFACSETSTYNDLCANHKSKSLSDILAAQQRTMVRSRSSVPSLGGIVSEAEQPPPEVEEEKVEVKIPKPKPKLVKQKKSINEEDAEEDLDKPTDMKDLVKQLPDFKISAHGMSRRGGVLKQSSLNEELMSTERLREKERVRKNIQKQASLNEDYLYRRHKTLDSLRDSFFSTSATTAKKFQSLKNGLTHKLKTSTTHIEKATVNSFVRILQGWKSHEMPSPTQGTCPNNNDLVPPNTPPADSRSVSSNSDDLKSHGERRHSKEDGSDSSKDSSLQSDTSVDSEDSFASVIFVPKADANGLQDPLSPTPLSPGPSSPRMKVSSVPTSPRVKNAPGGLPSPRLKQLPLVMFPIIRPPGSPKATQAPVQINKTLTPQISIQQLNSGNIPPQSRSQPNSPPKSNSITIIDSKSNVACQKVVIELESLPFDLTPEEPDFPLEPSEAEIESKSKELLAEINRDVEEINKLTAETNTMRPRVLQDTKPYPKITLQTVAELPEIPQFKGKKESVEDKSPSSESLNSRLMDRKRRERLKQIRDLLRQRPGFASTNSRTIFPIVRRCSTQEGKVEPTPKPLPRLLSLELFNPETDDMDSDSSGVSSPDSVDSVISVLPEDQKSKSKDKDHTIIPTVICEPDMDDLSSPKSSPSNQSLIEAVAEVAHTLDETCEAVIQSSPRAKRKQLEKMDSTETMSTVQTDSIGSNWSLNKLSPGDLRLLEERSRSHSHTSSSGSTSSLERLSPGRRSKERSPKQGSTSNSTWSLNKLSPIKHEGKSFEDCFSKCRRSPTKFPYDSISMTSLEGDKGIIKSDSFSRLQANERLVTCKSDIVMSNEEEDKNWNNECKHHLTEFAEKLSEKLLLEIDQYSKRMSEEDFDIYKDDRRKMSQCSSENLTMKIKHSSIHHSHRESSNAHSSNKSSMELRKKCLTNELYDKKFEGMIKCDCKTKISKLPPEECNQMLDNNVNNMEAGKARKFSGKTLEADKGSLDNLINNNNSAKTDSHVPNKTDDSENKTVNLSVKLSETKVKVPAVNIIESNGNPEITIVDSNEEVENKVGTNQSIESGYSLESEISVDSFCTDKRSSLKVGQSSDSSEVERMEISPESVTPRSSASTAPLKPGFSVESSDAGDISGSGSDWSRRDTNSCSKMDCGGSTASLGCASTASLASCSDWAKERKLADGRSSSEETAPVRSPLVRQKAEAQDMIKPGDPRSLQASLSDTSQDSLPSDNGGGAITFHRYYHVFKEGELDQLIEKYVENLHIISSYYDHANWCVVAEKVQVWTI